MIILKDSIAKKLEEEARKHDMTPEEYLLEILTQDLDPQERAKEYLKTAEELLRQAKEELERGDFRQAAEKLWGSAALAVKAYAYWKDGKRLASHGELWKYKNKLMRDLGEWVYEAWMVASGMHVCFYEGWCDKEDVERATKWVERLVRGVAKSIESS